MDYRERIEQLRRHALAKDVDHIEWEYLYEQGWLKSADSPMSNAARFAEAFNEAFRRAEPAIDDQELIVGKISGRPLTEEEKAEYQNIVRYAKRAKMRTEGQDSHLAIDFELLLREGITGIQAIIGEKKKKLRPEAPEDREKLDFYDSCLLALDGVAAFSRRYADRAQELAETEPDDERKAELYEIARICRTVPLNPARSFHEAIQSVHFVNFCLGAKSGLYQLGRPDRYLYRYYREDREKGVLDADRAQYLIDCLGILLNENIHSSLAIGLMVGGSDEHGHVFANELTYLFVKSVENVRLIYPGVGLCVRHDTPEDLMRLAYSVLAQGHSHPALFNDEIIVKGLRGYGLSPAEACNYIHSTCVEITPIATSACWVASPYTNLPQLVLDSIAERPEAYDQFEKIFYRKLSEHIRRNVIDENRKMSERTLYTRNPLLSCFVDDCLSLGRDIENGGARYNWIMPSFVGAANAVDSMMALKKHVYEEKRYTIDALCAMLEADFAGYEADRLVLRNRTPKYGNDDNEVDEMMVALSRFLVDECGQYRTSRGGLFIPSLFCWIMHEQFGTATKATPDGRPAGFPLGDGSGPAQGNEKQGPTASILSSTKWEHTPFIGGIAVNMKFSKRVFRETSIAKLDAIVRTYLQRGGFELQINVVDKSVLMEAKVNPEKYSDLVVRVGGYSDYFVRLSPQMQEEVIARTEHEL